MRGEGGGEEGSSVDEYLYVDQSRASLVPFSILSQHHA